jgi:UDP-glucose 6-dehydrogenase
MKKLGIVGHGFVGSAINQGFTKNVKKYVVDPNKFGSNTIQQLIKFKPDAVFVSVPTPQLESGECNSEIVESVLQELNQAKDLLVIIKSTVPAYKLQSIKEQCINLRIVYNPEFLTEKNYINDFKNPPMHLFVKYCINSFLATKVTFMNEMYDVLKAAKGTEWSEFVKMINSDPRIGKTHMQVPGNDGARGYAGSCFPKDTSALAYFAREILNTPFTQLETSIEINEKLRKKNQS